MVAVAGCSLSWKVEVEVEAQVKRFRHLTGRSFFTPADAPYHHDGLTSAWTWTWTFR
jgi:hypothetical protein